MLYVKHVNLILFEFFLQSNTIEQSIAFKEVNADTKISGRTAATRFVFNVTLIVFYSMAQPAFRIPSTYCYIHKYLLQLGISAVVVIPAVAEDSLWVDPSVVTDTSVVVVALSTLVTPKMH